MQAGGKAGPLPETRKRRGAETETVVVFERTWCREGAWKSMEDQ